MVLPTGTVAGISSPTNARVDDAAETAGEAAKIRARDTSDRRRRGS
jgi:hypothetical protein